MTEASSTFTGKGATSSREEEKEQALSPYLIFAILLVPRLLAAQYSIIGDCDEGKTLVILNSAIDFQCTTTGSPLIISFMATAFKLGNILQYMQYGVGLILPFMR
jgi:hypothetical protein